MGNELGIITKDINGYKIYIKNCLMCGKKFSVKGNHKYQKFCSYKCSGDYKHFTKERWGKLSKCWKGGEIIDVAGYKRVLIEGKGKYKKEQRKIVEEDIGRELKSSEIVHHKDGSRLNNNISNLRIMTKVEHTILHKPWIFTKNYKIKMTKERSII